MYLKTIFITALLHPAQFAALIQTSWNALIILGSISGFFTNLYNDLTAFALVMATFFFAWAALLYMTANQNENHRVQARSNLYIALGGLALALRYVAGSSAGRGRASGRRPGRLSPLPRYSRRTAAGT
jgi:hypothetical protein